MNPNPKRLSFGLKPHKPDPRDLKLVRYLLPTLPAPPEGAFGHADKFPRDGWGMLGNDHYGDCAWAGAAHEHMLLESLGGKTMRFDDNCVLHDYAAATGFDVATGDHDNGTDLREQAQYRTDVGVHDVTMFAHKIGAYVWLDPGNPRAARQALFLFDVIGVGFMVPSSCIDQFRAGQPWDVVEDDGGIEGGHYVVLVGFAANGNLIVVTWGQTQEMTPAFYAKYSDQAIAYISTEQMTSGKTPEGFDLPSLQQDIELVGTQSN